MIDGEYVQTINSIDELIEVSIVTVPAYRDTSVEVAQRNKGLKEFKEKTKNSNSTRIRKPTFRYVRLFLCTKII